LFLVSFVRGAAIGRIMFAIVRAQKAAVSSRLGNQATNEFIVANNLQY
jgi:hypothetical protein